MLIPVIAFLAARSVAAETVLGVVVFTRHGDRTSKLFPPTQLTTLGLNQVQQSGSVYRSTYIVDGAPKQIFDISTPDARPSQVFAATPDEATLYSTGYGFLQGLYPPAPAAAQPELLANGSTVAPPFGLNFLTLHGENADAPESIWLKGDVACPAYTAAAKSYQNSSEFIALSSSTKSFYQSFTPLLTGVFNESDISYGKAYEIFDYLNVGYIHNDTIRNAMTADQLFQLRTLADTHEWALAFNATQADRSLPARTFIGKVVAQLNQTLTNPSGPKFSLLVGSYITFQSFFGFASLQAVSPDWIAVPDYASTIVFEAVTNATVTNTLPSLDEVSVRFLFRNTSNPNPQLVPAPLFASGKDHMSWSDFISRVEPSQIVTAADWCSACHGTSALQPFCPIPQTVTASSFAAGMKPAVAGVVGAMVTLGVAALLVFIAGLLGLRLVRRASQKAQSSVLPTSQVALQKEPSHDGSSATKTM